MKIIIDINHPAHVHYFKNLIKEMENRGHEFCIISRNKEIEHLLLYNYSIPFVSRGRGGQGILAKVLYFFYAILIIIKHIIRFKPNLVISFGTPYPAIASTICRIPHISINDTEHAKMHHLLTDPFSKYILTPASYIEDLGDKHIRFNGYMEQSYLSPEYFTPDVLIYNQLGLSSHEDYIIVRLVSWNAVHDSGERGLNYEEKREMVESLSKYAKVFISSENDLPTDLKKYQIQIPPQMMHHALAYATLFIGEGATMASESAMLGTPCIYINSLTMGYIEELTENGLVFSFRDYNGLLSKAIEILEDDKIKQEILIRRSKLLREKINVTQYFIEFLESHFK